MRTAAITLAILLPCAAYAQAPAGKPRTLPPKSPTSQQKVEAKPKPTTGTVSGKIFLINRLGDFKPARLAVVALLNLSPADTKTYAIDNNPLSLIFLRRLGQYLSSCHLDRGFCIFANMESVPVDECNWEVKAAESALTETIQHDVRPANAWEYIGVRADEEGAFSIMNVPAGNWTFLAIGRAGANQAYWQLDVDVRAGETTPVKASSPEGSCLDL